MKKKKKKRNKKESARETMGRGKRSLSSLFSLPIVPRALLFSFSPASPQHKEALAAEERELRVNQKLSFSKQVR